MRLRPSADCSRRRRVEGSRSSRPTSATSMLATEALSVSKASPTFSWNFLAVALLTAAPSGCAALHSTSQPLPARVEDESERERSSAETSAMAQTVAAANLGTQAVEIIVTHHDEPGA